MAWRSSSLALGRRRFVRAMVAGGVVGLGSLAAPQAARASEVSAEIALSKTRARVGERVGIKLSVTSTAGDPPEPEFPDALDASFEVVRSETAFGSSAVLQHGRLVRSSTRSLSAVLIPNKPGTYRLSFSVPVAAGSSKTVRSNEIELVIVDGEGSDGGSATSDQPAESESETETGSESNRPTQAKSDVFLWASVDKPVAYVGEQVTYHLDVYERRQFLNMHLRKTPTFTDFFTEDLSERESSLQEVAGITYRVRPGIARALFPQKAGRLTIGPAEIAIGLRRREESQTIELEVLPLPAEGRPGNFSPNNVGRYSIETSVDRTELQPGEPFTLTVTIEGTGNIAVLDPGTWPVLPGARRYDPKVETRRHGGEVVGGQRTYKFLVIPERTGKLVIPEHELHYFDPQQKAYGTARAEAIELHVGDDDGEGVAVGTDADTADDTLPTEPLADVIVVDAVPRREPRERWLTPDRWMIGMGAVPIAASLGLAVGAAWRRFGPDDAARELARRRAHRKALVERARTAVPTGEGFHAALAKLLHEVAVQRAGPDGVGLPRPELLRLLEQRGVDADAGRKLEDLLERCDAARFGALRGTPDERQVLLDEALALMNASKLLGGAR
jgi:hypothetical protein